MWITMWITGGQLVDKTPLQSVRGRMSTPKALFGDWPCATSPWVAPFRRHSQVIHIVIHQLSTGYPHLANSPTGLAGGAFRQKKKSYPHKAT